jgi:alanine racemase
VVDRIIDTPAPPTVGHRYPGLRPSWAEIDLAAVRHNARLLSRHCAPAALCAVVKADAYGHGALSVARAAVEGGATWLAVALVEEGVELRDAGIDAPVLVLSEPTADAMAVVVDRGLTPTLYTPAGVRAAAAAASAAGTTLDVHVKVDTGMHRVGADPSQLVDLVRSVDDLPSLRFAALWSHLSVADVQGEEAGAFTAGQVRLLDDARAALVAVGLDPPMVHLANSAGAIAHPGARLDMVRCGIALYGVPPMPGIVPHAGGSDDGTLRPVLTLRSEVSLVRSLAAGERPSYGRRRPLDSSSIVATVPIGYADGIPRRYFTEGGTVLIGGRRRPLAGTVTMDQIVVDCGPDSTVSVGDEVVLIGSQGPESLTVWDWATVLGTIGNEVLTEIGSRVPRVLVDTDRAGRSSAEEES